jgi:hypothetical protein
MSAFIISLQGIPKMISVFIDFADYRSCRQFSGRPFFSPEHFYTNLFKYHVFSRVRTFILQRKAGQSVRFPGFPGKSWLRGSWISRTFFPKVPVIGDWGETEVRASPTKTEVRASPTKTEMRAPLKKIFSPRREILKH